VPRPDVWFTYIHADDDDDVFPAKNDPNHRKGKRKYGKDEDDKDKDNKNEGDQDEDDNGTISFDTSPNDGHETVVDVNNSASHIVDLYIRVAFPVSAATAVDDDDEGDDDEGDKADNDHDDGDDGDDDDNDDDDDVDDVDDDNDDKSKRKSPQKNTRVKADGIAKTIVDCKYGTTQQQS
jgi:hypothetical protein